MAFTPTDRGNEEFIVERIRRALFFTGVMVGANWLGAIVFAATSAAAESDALPGQLVLAAGPFAIAYLMQNKHSLSPSGS